MDAVAFEPHDSLNRVVVNAATLDKPIEVMSGTPFVTDDPALVRLLDEAHGVKRVAKGESKREAREKAEAKS